MENNLIDSRRKLEARDLIRIGSSYYYVFRIQSGKAFLYGVDKELYNQHGIIAGRHPFDSGFSDYWVVDVASNHYTIIGQSDNYLPKPVNWKEYVDFVFKTLPNISFGDVVYAKRPKSICPRQYRIDGHENGPFFVLSVNDGRIFCLYMTGNCWSKDTIKFDQQVGLHPSYVRTTVVYELAFYHFISKLDIEPSYSDCRKIRKVFTLNFLKNGFASKHRLIVDDKINFEVGDLVSFKESEELIIVGKNADNTFTAIEAVEMDAQTAEKYSRIDYYNPKIVSGRWLRYINSLPDNLLETVLEKYKEGKKRTSSVVAPIKEVGDSERKLSAADEVSFEVGDLVSFKGAEELIIVGKNGDDSYIAIKVSRMSAQMANKHPRIDYYNPKVVPGESLRYIKSLSADRLKTVLKDYKKRINEFYDSDGNRIMPVGALIKGEGKNLFYVFAVENNIAHCFLVFYNAFGSNVMSIAGKKYDLLFNSLYDVNIACADLVVKGLATKVERKQIAARMSEVSNQNFMTISNDKSLVGKIVRFNAKPNIRTAIVAEQVDSYFVFDASDLLEGNYRNGYFIRKSINGSYCEPTAEEQEAINAYLGRQYSGEGLVFTLKNNVENE